MSTMLPIHTSDIKLDLGPGRHRDLPQIYKTASHPLVENWEGNIYFYIQDLSEEGMRRSGELEKVLRIPHGPESRALEEGGQSSHFIKAYNNPCCLGFPKLIEGDVVFARGLQAPSSGELDAVVCWVTGRYVMEGR